MENSASIQKVSIEQELKRAYLEYSMSVIVGRALPDVRDGLKPVHRRVLYAMHELNNDWNKPYKKSARIVGDVIGKYHPHGDSAVYDTIVRMAQNFAMRYVLVDGQGNFGSVDGDSPAAMRYTEIRMAKITHDMLVDIDKDTVDFIPNYDDNETLPDILPTRIPGLLINGSIGIAVGMATNIPPHNICEVIDACQLLLDNPQARVSDLMQHMPGPDFPTRGIINGSAGIVQAYNTGRGKIYISSRYHCESAGSEKQSIVVTEIPYQVNKARLIERIAELVRDKKITGISELRDESDKDGMRIVIELKRHETTEVIVNNLFKHTDLETSYGINMVVLDKRQPKLMNLVQILKAFLDHRYEIVTRRTAYLLRKARERGHLLEGLVLALSNLNEVIELIRAAPSPQVAKEQLLARHWHSSVIREMVGSNDIQLCRPDNLEEQYGYADDFYNMSPQQAQAILDLRLHRLTGLERDKLFTEYKDIIATILDLIDILNNPDRVKAIVKDELQAIREQHGDERHTQITASTRGLTDLDLIAEEQVVVTISRAGYAKSQPLADYRAQRRGGKGKIATRVKDEDQVIGLMTLSNLETILCFSNRGIVYWLKVYEIPQAGRTSKGRPLVNLLPLQSNEKITVVLPLPNSSKTQKKSKHDYSNQFICMATSNGTIKRSALDNFSKPRMSGLRAVTLVDGDELIGAAITDGSQEIMLVSDNGKAIRFHESDVRDMGRTAQGVRGIRLQKDEATIAMIVVDDNASLLIANENGYGKRTENSKFSTQFRGGQGVIAMRQREGRGKVIGVTLVNEEDELMLITDQGTLVRLPVNQISVIGRNSLGVRLIRLQRDERLVSMEKISTLTEEKDEENDESPTQQQ